MRTARVSAQTDHARSIRSALWEHVACFADPVRFMLMSEKQARECGSESADFNALCRSGSMRHAFGGLGGHAHRWEVGPRVCLRTNGFRCPSALWEDVACFRDRFSPYSFV